MDIVMEIATGLWGLMFKAFVILMPLIVFLEWARTRCWFKQFVGAVHPIFQPVGFQRQAIFPLVTGLFFGISYGAGVLIPQARSGELDLKQVFLIGAFLGICHAVFEDTLLFVVIGGNGWVMIVTRFVAAVIVVSLLARLPWPAATPVPAVEGGVDSQ